MGALHVKGGETSSGDKKSTGHSSRQTEAKSVDQVLNPLGQGIVEGVSQHTVSSSLAGLGVVQRMCQECDKETKYQPLDSGSVQAQLTIGARDGSCEKEADAVADTVMRASRENEQESLASAPSLAGESRTTLFRSPQRSLSNDHGSSSKSGYLARAVTNPGDGSPMDRSVRQRVEPVLGADLSSIRVHEDRSSRQLADGINAKAFTHGNHIYLGSGYEKSDLRLMAHEATHTVQQSQSASAMLMQRDVTDQSIGPGYAAELDDGELAYQLRLVEGLLGSQENLQEEDALSTNLHILREEYFSRDPGANAVGFGPEPRPTITDPYTGLIPEGGETINQVGVVAWDGDPELRLRSAPDTNDESNIIGHLPFSTRLQLIKRFPGGWYFVSTPDGNLGYTAADYIFVDMPEPNARLHRVESGVSGTAIAIAEHYYGEYADDWGQDLRFYVNVLAWANNKSVPDTTGGWRYVHFQAGELVWVPSQPFAYSLKGVVNSGSYSYNIADFIGVADFIERVGELWADFRRAVELSGQYMAEAIATRLSETLIAMAEGLAVLLLGAVAILAISTAVGAAIGALAGGVGAAPGAAAGFEVGMVIIEWLGLAMLVYWIIDSLVQLGEAFGEFLGTVWDARGDEETLDLAARQFADAIALLIAKIFEALVMFLMAKGLPKGIKVIEGTRLGRALGETRAVRWLTERHQAIQSGEAPLPGPRQVAGRILGTGRPGAEPAPVARVGQTQHFHNLPPERLPSNLPEGHFWMRSAEGEWVLMREAGVAEVPFELSVYSDGMGNTNYVLRTGNRMVQSDALTRQDGTYASGQQRLPNELEGTGTENPYRTSSGEVYDKGHGIDYADTLEGPGVRSSTTDPANFTPQQSWWNRGPRNTLVGRIRNGHAASGRPGGGGYREMAIYGENPPVTADGTPIPREFIFVETNRAGVAQRAWRIPNQAGAGTRSISSMDPHAINLSEVPPVMLRSGATIVQPSASMTYTPFVIYGFRGDDEAGDAIVNETDAPVCIDNSQSPVSTEEPTEPQWCE